MLVIAHALKHMDWVFFVHVLLRLGWCFWDRPLLIITGFENRKTVGRVSVGLLCVGREPGVINNLSLIG